MWNWVRPRRTPTRLATQGVPCRFTSLPPAWYAVLALSSIFTVLRFTELMVGSTTDDAIYVEVARSIAEGRGPVIHLSDYESYPQTVFPIGYPSLLSPIAAVFPHSLPPLQLL